MSRKRAAEATKPRSRKAPRLSDPANVAPGQTHPYSEPLLHFEHGKTFSPRDYSSAAIKQDDCDARKADRAMKRVKRALRRPQEPVVVTTEPVPKRARKASHPRRVPPSKEGPKYTWELIGDGTDNDAIATAAARMPIAAPRTAPVPPHVSGAVRRAHRHQFEALYGRDLSDDQSTTGIWRGLKKAWCRARRVDGVPPRSLEWTDYGHDMEDVDMVAIFMGRAKRAWCHAQDFEVFYKTEREDMNAAAVRDLDVSSTWADVPRNPLEPRPAGKLQGPDHGQRLRVLSAALPQIALDVWGLEPGTLEPLVLAFEKMLEQGSSQDCGVEEDEWFGDFEPLEQSAAYQSYLRGNYDAGGKYDISGFDNPAAGHDVSEDVDEDSRAEALASHYFRTHGRMPAGYYSDSDTGDDGEETIEAVIGVTSDEMDTSVGDEVGEENDSSEENEDENEEEEEDEGKEVQEEKEEEEEEDDETGAWDVEELGEESDDEEDEDFVL